MHDDLPLFFAPFDLDLIDDPLVEVEAHECLECACGDHPHAVVEPPAHYQTLVVAVDHTRHTPDPRLLRVGSRRHLLSNHDVGIAVATTSEVDCL